MDVSDLELQGEVEPHTAERVWLGREHLFGLQSSRLNLSSFS